MPNAKIELRKRLRAAREAHAEGQPNAIRSLLFHRPPAPLLAKIKEKAIIGLYHASSSEARASGYAQFFHERGHTIALPSFTAQDAPMQFREHTDPNGESDLECGPFGLMQPSGANDAIQPDVLFVPLIGFTDSGDRLGQGGGHYDKWLEKRPDTLKIGLAWDVQLCDTLPVEPHDIRLEYVVTPTRLYGFSNHV